MANTDFMQNDTIQFIDFAPRQRATVGERSIKLYDKGSSHCAYIGGYLKRVVREKGLRSLRVAQNKLTGEYFVVLVKNEALGTPLQTISGKERWGIRCKAFNTFLRDVFKVTSPVATIALSEDMSELDDMATFKIIGASDCDSE